MVIGRPRSKGCNLCLQRKVKCDEGKPACRNCIAYGKECPGYARAALPLIFRHETQRVKTLVMRSRKRTKKPISPQKSPESDVPPVKTNPVLALQKKYMQRPVPRSLYDSWQHRSHCFFMDQYTLPQEADGSPGPLDSIPLLYALCQGQGNDAPISCLRSALDAAAYGAMANKARMPSLALQSRRKYGQALRELNQALGSVSTAIRNETLGAIVLLIIFEDINSERDRLLSTHISGIQYLLKLRGANQLFDPATRSLFHFAFTQMTIQFLGLNDPRKIDLDWLMEVLTISHPIYSMMACVSRISKFCAIVAQMLAVSDISREILTSLLEMGERLDLEFNQWYIGMPEEWLPWRVQSADGRIMVYPDVTAAGVWNYYRGARVILQQNLINIHKTLDVLLDPPIKELITLQSPEDIIIEMITQVCESIPFAFGDVDQHGRPTSSYGRDESGIKAIQEFALMWPMWNVTQCGLATIAQENQAREALRRLGLSNGIKLALSLADESTVLNTPHVFG